MYHATISAMLPFADKGRNVLAWRAGKRRNRSNRMLIATRTKDPTMKGISIAMFRKYQQ